MPQYLLLRDNKQSGPYSFEELTAKGLKAYDLIWIEGKSAAWRYPSEVDELKPFAPVIEEQPYDRFYKKRDTTVRKQEEKVATKEPETTPVKTPLESLNANRHIVVILPNGQTLDKQQQRVVFHETVENKIQQPERKANAVQKPVGLEDDFIESPVTVSYAADKTTKAYPTARASANKGKKKGFFHSKTSKVLSGTLVLLLVGGFIGWAFTHIGFQRQRNAVPAVTPAQTVKIDEPRTVFNNETAQTVNQIDNAEPLPPLVDPNTDSSQLMSAAASLTTGVAKKTTVKLKNTEQKKQDDSEQFVPLLTPAVQEPVRAIADNNDDADKKPVRKNINELVKVTKNDYKVGPFGGLSNIQVKVSNNSGYPLDLVVVEVKYVLANKKEFKTENLYFKNLAPGATVVKEAPKSSRGISLESKVALVSSKAVGIYQAGL